MTDANGKILTSVMAIDSNRLSASVDPNGIRVSFSYDKAGQQTAIPDGRGNFTTFTFDNENRLTGVNGAGSLSTYTYAGDGLRRTAQEPGGTVKTMIWDGDDYLGEY